MVRVIYIPQHGSCVTKPGMYNTNSATINRLIIVLLFILPNPILLPSIQQWLPLKATSRNKQMISFTRFANFLLPYIFGHAFSAISFLVLYMLFLLSWNTLLCHHLVITDLSSNPQLSVTSAMPLWSDTLSIIHPHGIPSPQITTVWTWVSFTRLWAPEDGGSCVYLVFYLAPRI